MLYSFDDLDAIFDAMKIAAGDTVYFASDIAKLCEKHGRGAASELIDSLQQRITPSGTLLVPTFSWDFCHGLGYDIRRTQSRTGALSRIALSCDGFIRTRHPMYSFAVWGADAELYGSLDNKSSFGKDSPFGVMTERDAYLLTFCVCYEHSMTYQHYVEEMIGVSWRYQKDFSGKYISMDGQESDRLYSMYVRRLDMDVQDVNGYDDECASSMASIDIEVEGERVRKAYLRDVYKVFEDDILHNEGRRFVHYKTDQTTALEIVKRIADALEVPETDELSLDMPLADIPEWDSLGMINIVTMIKAQCGRLMSIPELKALKTVGDIAEIMLEDEMR